MDSKKEALETLRLEMEKDDLLPLKKGATRLVFGVGNPDAAVLFIGEGPGYWEDQKGEPFVGNAGKFLDQLLHSIKLPRESVYITNVVHHRPPENRDPLPDEIAAYGKYLDKIIEIINPKIISTLGRFSMGKFLPGVYISAVHGKVHKTFWKEKEMIIIPMYHPAAGLRRTDIKNQTVRDFLKIPEILSEIEDVEEEEENSEQMQLV